jgi:hypothetical protein
VGFLCGMQAHEQAFSMQACVVTRAVVAVIAAVIGRRFYDGLVTTVSPLAGVPLVEFLRVVYFCLFCWCKNMPDHPCCCAR